MGVPTPDNVGSCFIPTAATLKGFGLMLARRAAKAIAPQADTVCPTAELFITALMARCRAGRKNLR